MLQSKVLRMKIPPFQVWVCTALWATHTAGDSVSVHSSCEHYALQVRVWVCTAPVRSTLQVTVWVCTAPVSGTHCRLQCECVQLPWAAHTAGSMTDSGSSPLPAEEPSTTSDETGILQSPSSGANALFRGKVLHYSGIVKGKNRASFRIFLPKRNINKIHELAHMKFLWKQDCLRLQLFQWASLSFAELLFIHKWTLHFASGTEVSLGFQTHTLRGQNPGQWFSDLRWNNSHWFNQLPTSVSTSKPC